jgi:hypothetical protein
MNRTVLHSACTVAEVPPFRYLTPGRSHEQAACDAAKSLGITDAASLITLLWKLRSEALS